MSVINKMLRDLDKQQNSAAPHRSHAFQPPKKNYLLIWLVVPVALLVGWLAQSWFQQQSQQLNQPVVQQQGPEKPLDPIELAKEFVPGIAEIERQKAELMGTTEQTVSAKEVIASKIPPKVAAALGRQGSAQTQSSDQPQSQNRPATELQSFVRPPVAEQRVVQVKDVTVDDSNNPDSAAPMETEDVLVDTYLPESELLLESEPHIASAPERPAKPRSLAIERVDLSTEQQITLFKEKAAKAESAGQLAQAAEYWRLIRQTTPDMSEPYLELARLLQVQGNDAEAFNVLQQASVSAAQDPKVSMALAALALKQQDWTKALTYLQYDPDILLYADFYALKAAALQKTNQHSQAIQVFQQLARQQPEQARWWLGMALSYDALQQNQQATLAYRQALVNGTTLSASSLDYVKKRIAVIE